MDVAELRKRVLRELERVKHDATERRRQVDEARAAFETLHNSVIVPLVRQLAIIVKAEGHPFQVYAPTESVQLVADRSPDTFIAIELDTEQNPPRLVGRTSVGRGGRVIVDERDVVPSTPVAEITEEDVTVFLLGALRRVLAR